MLNNIPNISVAKRIFCSIITEDEYNNNHQWPNKGSSYMYIYIGKTTYLVMKTLQR